MLYIHIMLCVYIYILCIQHRISIVNLGASTKYIYIYTHIWGSRYPATGSNGKFFSVLVLGRQKCSETRFVGPCHSMFHTGGFSGQDSMKHGQIDYDNPFDGSSKSIYAWFGWLIVIPCVPLLAWSLKLWLITFPCSWGYPPNRWMVFFWGKIPI